MVIDKGLTHVAGSMASSSVNTQDVVSDDTSVGSGTFGRGNTSDIHFVED